jgi:hypothetical protein
MSRPESSCKRQQARDGMEIDRSRRYTIRMHDAARHEIGQTLAMDKSEFNNRLRSASTTAWEYTTFRSLLLYQCTYLTSVPSGNDRDSIRSLSSQACTIPRPP